MDDEMRDDLTMSASVEAALARANEIEAASAAAVVKLRTQAAERDANGRPTGKANTARQKLASPALTSTVASVALRERINPALHAAIDEVERAEVAFSTAVSALRALQARKELFEEAKGAPIKRPVIAEQLEPEEWKFVHEMRARNVPVSAMDQLTEPELDFIAGLFVEKQRDYRHRDRAGAWWTLVRAGLLDVQSDAFDDDERAAILAARDDSGASARRAYDALCEIAGRQLDIPHAFAEFAVAFARDSSKREPVGLYERNVDRLTSTQLYDDATKLLDTLGLPIDEIRRAFRLLQTPAVVSYAENADAVHADQVASAALYRQLVDRYRPAARKALAERHEAERQQERDLLGADELGQFDREAALRKLGAYDDEPPLGMAMVIRQVRLGTFAEDRENERRQTIDELARALAESENTRRAISERDIVLPDVSDLIKEHSLVPPRTAESEVGIPGPALQAEPGATAAASPAAPVLPNTQLTSAETYGLPDDVRPEAAAAYYDIARRAAIAYDEWPQMTWPYAKADPSIPVSVEAMVGEFEKLERDGRLDETSQQYLTLVRTRSISEGNKFLIDRHARALIAEVANAADFEDHRRTAGFPRQSRI